MQNETAEHKAHMRIINRCIKRRRRLRPANVVDRIRVNDPAWAAALISRIQAAGYDPKPGQSWRHREPIPYRSVAVPVIEWQAVLVDALAAAQGISPEKFMQSVLSEGLFEAFLEMKAQARTQPAVTG